MIYFILTIAVCSVNASRIRILEKQGIWILLQIRKLLLWCKRILSNIIFFLGPTTISWNYTLTWDTPHEHVLNNKKYLLIL